jgi:16S rRNA processing protein RimM
LPILSRLFFFSRLFVKQLKSCREYRVESFRLHKDSFVVKLEGVQSIDEASGLVGAEVLVTQEELRDLEGDGFYFFQIEGSSVITKDGKPLGKVIDVLTIPDNDVLVVELEGTEILVPFTPEICIQVDAGKKEIVIDPPEGLLELDEI